MIGIPLRDPEFEDFHGRTAIQLWFIGVQPHIGVASEGRSACKEEATRDLE